jgi:hypothetical protein
MVALMEIGLLNSTNNPQADEILRGVIGICEMTFPERVRAYYLVGSYQEGTAVTRSDLDLCLVFKDEATDEEKQQVAALGRHCTRLSPIRTDLSGQGETELRQSGVTGLKLRSLLLYGQDIRDSLPLEPLSVYLRQAVQGYFFYLRMLRGHAERLLYPVHYPDPQGEFYGYERWGIYTGQDVQPGTRTLINGLALGATVLVGLLAGHHTGSKLAAVRLYQELVGDEWATFLTELYERCKQQWGYELPETAEERAHLRQLCRQSVAFENHVLAHCRNFLLAELCSGDEAGRYEANARLGEVIYNDPEVQAALAAQV